MNEINNDYFEPTCVQCGEQGSNETMCENMGDWYHASCFLRSVLNDIEFRYGIKHKLKLIYKP